MTENAHNADFRKKPQIFADSPLLLEIPAFGGRRKPQKTADLSQKTEDFRRKPQIGLRHLRCVTFSSALDQEQKISSKSKFIGTDIPRTSGGHSRGYPDPKLRSGSSKCWKNKHLGTDIHDPKARTSMTPRDLQKLRSEKLWAELSFPKRST